LDKCCLKVKATRFVRKRWLPPVANIDFLDPIDADFNGLKREAQKTHTAL
jgi:hypothetical protein